MLSFQGALRFGMIKHGGTKKQDHRNSDAEGVAAAADALDKAHLHSKQLLR